MAAAADKEIEIHRQILAGNDLALSKLYDLYGESIVLKLKSWYRGQRKMDDALFYESVNEAFFGYYNNPMTFDPNQNTLHRFLEIASERDLINLLAKNNNRTQGKEKLLDDVELQNNFGNRNVRVADNPEFQIIFVEFVAEVNKELSNHFSNEKDIEIAKLILAKVRETEKYSAILEISELTNEAQQSEVKKNKDRIKLVIERKGIEEKIRKMIL